LDRVNATAELEELVYGDRLPSPVGTLEHRRERTSGAARLEAGRPLVQHADRDRSPPDQAAEADRHVLAHDGTARRLGDVIHLVDEDRRLGGHTQVPTTQLADDEEDGCQDEQEAEEVAHVSRMITRSLPPVPWTLPRSGQHLVGAPLRLEGAPDEVPSQARDLGHRQNRLGGDSLGSAALDVPEYRVEDAAVEVVVDLDSCVEPADDLEVDGRAVLTGRRDGDTLLGLKWARHLDVEGLPAGEAEHVWVLAVEELQRQHAHAHEVRPVDALVAPGDDRLDAQQVRALGGPVAARAHAVVVTGQHDRGNSLAQVVAAGLVDALDLAV